jgi:hypothetical protein
MKLRIFFLSGLLEMIFFASIAQPSIEWQRCFGGSEVDEPSGVIACSDGGYLIFGSSRSQFEFEQNGDVFGHHGGYYDGWVFKINSEGEILWTKCFGGSSEEQFRSGFETSDGDYIIGGYSSSSDYDVTINYGLYDIWIIRIDSEGELIWEKSFGGSSLDRLSHLEPTFDGGFILCGVSLSQDGDLQDNNGGFDSWVAKIDPMGNIEWQKNYGGDNSDQAYMIKQTDDGGYILLNSSSSDNGDVLVANGSSDIWVLKLNSVGDILWQSSIGGSGWDAGYTIFETIDGGYLIGGLTDSNDGDLNSNFLSGNSGLTVKLSAEGNLNSVFVIGGSEHESLSYIGSEDSNYLLAGATYSNDGNILDNNGQSDLWVIKVNDSFEVLWSRCYGGSQLDYFDHMLKLTDGYLLVGETYSNDGDVSGNHGGTDVWVLKLSEDVYVKEDVAESLIEVFPTNATDQLYVKSNSLFKGYMFSIVDMTGKEVKTGIINADQIEIGISDLPSGPYLFRIIGQASEIVKFIKE